MNESQTSSTLGPDPQKASKAPPSGGPTSHLLELPEVPPLSTLKLRLFPPSSPTPSATRWVCGYLVLPSFLFGRSSWVRRVGFYFDPFRRRFG